MRTFSYSSLQPCHCRIYPWFQYATGQSYPGTREEVTHTHLPKTHMLSWSPPQLLVGSILLAGTARSALPSGLIFHVTDPSVDVTLPSSQGIQIPVLFCYWLTGRSWANHFPIWGLRCEMTCLSRKPGEPSSKSSPLSNMEERWAVCLGARGWSMDLLVEAPGRQQVVCGLGVGWFELSFSGSIPTLHWNQLESFKNTTDTRA